MILCSGSFKFFLSLMENIFDTNVVFGLSELFAEYRRNIVECFGDFPGFVVIMAG